MADVTSLGITATTLQEYLDLVRQQYRDIDPDWDLSSESPDGLATAIWSETVANLDEALIAAFESVDPRTATGLQLDRLFALILLPRKGATASTVTLQLSGTSGSVIPAGTVFRNSDTGTDWATDSEVALSGSPASATVNATCQTLGAESAAVGSIDTIVTPVAGLSGVTNDDAASLGQDKESDRDYRIRGQQSVALVGDNQVDTIRAALAAVDGVNRVKVVENFEGTPDSNGVDGHSLAIFIDGGSNADVAASIAANKSPGCGLNRYNSFPNKQVVATETPGGNSFEATFFRPELTTIYVRVTIDGPYVSDDVKQAIVDYAAGTLFNVGSGFDRNGFAIGDSVPVGKLYTPVNKVVGDNAVATEIQIGESSGSLGSAPISIPFNGLAVFDVSSIDVVDA